MNKQKLYDTIAGKAGVLNELSDTIWEYAELSMAEYRSAEYYCRLLEAEGFRVERNLCGIATAFSGSFGSGRPVIGLLGEYDALSGLSQEADATEPRPITEGGSGQGCGHNLLGAASLGAAIAIKEAIAAGDLKGTVVFYGCPGEEGCSGKTFMARDGMFRDLDAALTWHPGDTNEVTVGSCAATVQLEYSFQGLSAHAAGDPYNGRSGLDAVELMNVGVQFLREHMPQRCSIHYSITDGGGLSPNVVQAKAKVLYMIRGETVQEARKLLNRVDKIAQGAALMTETSVSSRQIDGSASTLSNTVLEEVLYRNMQEAPLPAYTPEEWSFAEKLHATYPASLPGSLVQENRKLRALVTEATDGGSRALNDFLFPYIPSDKYSPSSTDVGDVSWLTPTAQFSAVTWTSAIPGHSWQVVSMGKSGIARKGMVYAAQIMAGATADLLSDPELLKQAREEFAVSSAQGYDCPLGKEVIPAPL